MSDIFSGSDLIDIAIDIEKRGVMFYDIMAKSTDNEDARTVFEELVEMERDHIAIFQDMMGGYEEQQAPSQAYSEYLRALLDAAVFTDDLITGEMATQADSDIKALELAITAEKDSILFYYELRDILPGQSLPAINRIIAEEKSHLQQLSDIKKQLATS